MQICQRWIRAAVAIALMGGAAVCGAPRAASAALYAFYFEGSYFQVSHQTLAGDAFDRTRAIIWNAEIGAPISGVFLYNAAEAIDVTNNPVAASWANERNYFFPSPNGPFGPGEEDPQFPVTPAGISGYNYVNSNGKVFRFQAGLDDGGTAEPTLMKVTNNQIPPGGPFGPPWSDYWDTLTFRSRVNLDPVNGPFVRQLDILFIDGVSGGTEPGSKAISLPGDATDGSESTVPPSIAFADLPVPVGWGFGTDGHQGSISLIRRIAFGDTDGNGEVTAADIAPLVAHYNQAAGTYQINGDFDDDYTVPADWLGAAIWSHGDFNGDGVVDLQDYKIFLDPGLISAGAPRNFLPGDANFDHVVDISDINLIAANWQLSGPLGDTNADGIVDISDINLVAANWQQAGPPGGGAGAPASVPEPGSVTLALVGALCALVPVARRRVARGE